VQERDWEALALVTGGIAHDFNNLLAVIQSDAELALTELDPDCPAAAAINEITVAARRASGLAQQMLACLGRDRTQIERVDVNALVEESVSLATARLGNGYQVWFDLAAESPVVEANATQLSQVVMNLVINAGEALAGVEGARIRVSTAVVDLDADAVKALRPRTGLAPGAYCAILVVDNGSGMDEATLNRLFEPFFTTKPGGHGLGLASAEAIARSHRGAIDVQSAKGIGSAFRVLLPVQPRKRRG
jgi:signal transduction histidine kinase